jgi:Zn-dependent protease with chaperone function
MTYLVYLPLLLPALVTLVARHAGDRMRPRVGVLTLTGAAAGAAAASVWALVLLVLTLFDDLPSMVARARQQVLPEPVPDWVAVTAAALLLLAVVRLVRDVRLRREAVRMLRSADPAADDVVMADDDEPLAVAIPGRPGRILMTTGMARLLGPAERSAVLAHERAHLAHRHHLLLAAAGAAAAVNPLLRPVRETVAYLAERWADEEAAVVVGDRGLVAQAVARAALAMPSRAPKAALGVHGGVVVRRVRALQSPPPPLSRKILAAAAVVVVAGVTAAAVSTADFVVLLRTWLAA